MYMLHSLCLFLIFILNQLLGIFDFRDLVCVTYHKIDILYPIVLYCVVLYCINYIYVGTMTSVYYKYAIAAIIVFDVSRPATFDAVLKVCSVYDQYILL